MATPHPSFRLVSQPALHTGLLLSLAVAGCACSVPEEGDPSPGAGLTLHEALALVDQVQLQEVPGDTIGDVGVVEVLPDGGLVVADRLTPRLRAYGPGGEFQAAQGQQGEGPFEYGGILDVASDQRGRILVLGSGSRHITVLDSSLTPDTLQPLPENLAWARNVTRFADGLVLAGPVDGPVHVAYRPDAGGEGEAGGEGRAGGWLLPAGPDQLFTMPYWSSFAFFHLAARGDTLLVANSLLYPVRIVSRTGTLLGELGTPPPSFAPVPELEAGAFAFTDPESAAAVQERVAAWLRTFTVIAGLHLVADRWLVVTHGRFQAESAGAPPRVEEYALDAYDLNTGTRILEDVVLPTDARVLAGGPYLHVLVGGPPDPWTVARFRFREALGSSGAAAGSSP